MVRTSEDKTIDQFLTLYVINECYKTYNLRGLSETKLQKLIFLSEKKLIDQSWKALNYNFMKFFHGPFSSELRSNLERFVELNYINEPWLKFTNNLTVMLDDFNDLLIKNRDFIKKIDKVLETYAKIPTDKLLRLVYKMPWGRGRTIGSLSMKTPMLYPIKSRKAVKQFVVSENELEDLEICFNQKLSEDIEKAFLEMKQGRKISHETIFGKL